MDKKLFKLLTFIVIQILLLTYCFPDSYSFASEFGKGNQCSESNLSTLSPKLFIPQNVLIKTLQKKGLLLLSDEHLRVGPEKKKISWLEKKFNAFFQLFKRHPLMTVSMEGFQDQSSTQVLNANSKGGLGAFFGCLLWGFKKIGVKTVAFQPAFSRRRRQSIILKHDCVVENVRGVLSNLNWRDFQANAYQVVELITELSEHDNLSLRNFEQRVMADKTLKTGIYENGRGEEADSADRIGRENIAYVYTAALSILIDVATHGEKKEVAERAVKRAYTDMNIGQVFNGRIINKTVDILQWLSRQKQITPENFEKALNQDETLKMLVEKGQIKSKMLYFVLVNYLARTAITKQQFISEEPVSYDNEPGEYILDRNANEFTVTVGGLDINDPSKTRYYDVRFRKYLDGNLIRIQMVCPELYGVLYKGDVSLEGKRQRFNEYMVSAWAMYAFIKHFPQFIPGMVHFNESPFVLLAHLMRSDPALEHIPLIYTNHTVVQAGLPKYYENTASLERMFEIMAGGYMIKSGKFSFSMRGDLGEKAFSAMKKLFTHSGAVDLSIAALNIADVSNGVSEEHSIVTKELFNTTKKIASVLNGSSDYWKNEKLISLEDEKGKENISADELHAIHDSDGKMRFLAEIEKRTGIKLNEKKPVISLIRRIANYKSQYPILREIIHVLCADRGARVRTRWGDLRGLGLQVVIAGFANRESDQEKWIEEFLRWMNDPDLKGRFVFVPDSDVELLKLQAIGSDICVNCPLPFEEACGTSDQRNAENGGLNVVVYDSGGGKEYLVPVNRKKGTGSGWLVGKPKDGKPTYENVWVFYDKAPKDIYDALKEASEIYYDDPNLWKKLMLNVYRDSEKVTAEAMAKRYVENTFVLASALTQARLFARPVITDAILDAFLSEEKLELTAIGQAI